MERALRAGFWLVDAVLVVFGLRGLAHVSPTLAVLAFCLLLVGGLAVEAKAARG
jgi:hypothetical protein